MTVRLAKMHSMHQRWRQAKFHRIQNELPELLEADALSALALKQCAKFSVVLHFCDGPTKVENWSRLCFLGKTNATKSGFGQLVSSKM